IPHNAALVTANLLRKADMNVEVQAMDWSTMLTRRAKKDPVDQGGWNLLHTWATGADLLSPMTHFFVAANCDKAWFGWYCDPKVEELREQWARSTDAARQKQLSARTKIFLCVKIVSTLTDSQPSLFTTLINKKDMFTGAIYSKFKPGNPQLTP